MEYLVDHLYSEIKMAEISLEKAVIAKVRQASLNIIDDLQSEIDLLCFWLSHYYGKKYTPKIMPDHLEMLESMDNLDGLEFETLYLEKMADHDRELVHLVEKVNISEFRNDFQEMLNTIISEQADEIHMFNQLLKIRV